jgi:hypothetical protein
MAFVSGDFVERCDSFQLGCIDDLGGRDVAYAFTAPARGIYVFDSTASESDTVLALYGGDGCGEALGAELACVDDPIFFGGAARLAYELDADETVLVVLEAFDSEESGYYHIRVIGP